MAIKIKGVLRGEDASEQFALERKRFRNRLARQETEQAKKRQKLLEADDGKNKKLE